MHTNQTEDSKAILAVEKLYDDAWNQGDAGMLSSFFTPDAVIINPHGEVVEGRDEFKDLMGSLFLSRFKGSIHESKILRIHFLQGGVAVVDGEATVTEMSEQGDRSVTVVRFTDVMVKDSGRWLISDTRAYVFAPNQQS
ncbi:MAG: SgcJ/EcaC family oxidoreductase [Aliifodinibius sp.]|nr:SgcJ/EcaC family oxidoreductase [Fodinibius sp.]NIX00628.1 SgcJ/EcaC family oxidoreductase [Phycisphaerae bacterium]NIY28158.1 SgcJ/EcaC family oxidoreductase [Fodinibius sp.]